MEVLAVGHREAIAAAADLIVGVALLLREAGGDNGTTMAATLFIASQVTARTSRRAWARRCSSEPRLLVDLAKTPLLVANVDSIRSPPVGHRGQGCTTVGLQPSCTEFFPPARLILVFC